MAADCIACTECGAPTRADSPQGLCPQCLQTLVPTASQTPTEIGPVSDRPAPAALPQIGRRFGDYQLVCLLGQGGMGAVYEAEHLPSDRRVALKTLSCALETPDARKRFLREGRLAASVNHPNSVYVYGTEEIEGAPVISMELVAGGTLQECVQMQGPLPISRAVDMILQVIAGLVAAEAKGVLHRDVKPSNCFLDSDGTVKVGDYGLSFSIVTQGETHLTVKGAFLGTPAFSSPEHLRGEQVDLRSDIYSVGVTLYYLLTERTPFEGENFVTIVATVLQRPPASPASLRREIPRELADVILRCLEKSREHRFGDYNDLRQALLPFSSAAPTPAPLYLRASANLIDVALLVLLLYGAAAFIGRGDWSSAGQLAANLAGQTGLLFQLCYVFAYVLYFGITEGLWGASLGKMHFRLRVVGPNRNAPGVLKATLRYLVFAVFLDWPGWVAAAFAPADVADPKLGGPTTLALLTYWLLLAVLFATARPANGFAALHDLLTNTRVIRKPKAQPRPVVRVAEEELRSVEASRKHGPFTVLSTLLKTGSEEILLAQDPLLLRKVWLRLLPPGTPPLKPALRTLGRTGRCRLLNGKRTAAECWDAYEAASGAPFLRLIHERQPWKAVRYWLLDLAEELSAALRDQTLPGVIALDRIWITAESRAKLLDFPAPWPNSPEIDGSRPVGTETSVDPPIAAPLAQFLARVATTALEGWKPGSRLRQSSGVPVPLPLHSQAFLRRLKAASSLDGPISDLKSILAAETEVTRSQKFKLLFVCGPLLPSALGFVIAAWVGRPLDSAEAVKDLVLAATVFGGAFWLVCTIVPSLVCALLFRGGYLLHRERIAVVTADGSQASRLRVFWRSVVTWLPICLALIGALYSVFILIAVLLFYLGAAIWTILTPARGLQDRIAGTWLVRK